MKRLIFALAAAAILSGCANGYQQFYTPLATPDRLAMYTVPSQAPPTVRISTGNADSDVNALFAEGYSPIGYANFNGPMQGVQAAIAQGKTIGAALVVVSQQYTNTVQGAVPITIPTSQTSYTNGSVSAYGTGGYANGTYNGTTTTYGTSTTYVPYSVARYDQQAVFYREITRTGAGTLLRALTPEEAQRMGTQRAGYVRAIRRGSPAFKADILPGDIILKINGKPLDDVMSRPQYLDGANEFTIYRGGQIIAKTADIPSSW